MSEVRRHEFPHADKATQDEPPATPESPSWLKPGSDEEVRSLLSLLQGEQARPPEPPPPYQPPPTVEPPPPPPPPPAQMAEPPPAEVQAEPELKALELPEEIRLPSPPRLGSLFPGGRSNPPPANDTRDPGLQERVAAFASAAVELAIARAEVLTELEGQLLDLSMAVAAAIIEREVEADSALHVTLARAALQSLGGATSVTLRTSADGYDAITSTLGGEEIEMRNVRVHVVADHGIPGLGCIVEGENVRVDATINERLQSVRRAFEEERRRAMEKVE